MAVGTVTVTQATRGNIRKIICAVVASSTDGSVPDTVLPAIEGRLLALGTAPGTTNPTSLYDITVVDQFTYDVLEGVGANRSASAAQKAAIVYSGTGTHPHVDDSDTLTLKIANNSVNSAGITITLYYGLGS
jgi:hypothetical protein